MKFIIAMVLLFALVVVLMMLRSGPRITRIEHRRDETEDTDKTDDRKGED